MKRILEPLPKEKDGKIRIKDFISLDIHSEDAFDVSMILCEEKTIDFFCGEFHVFLSLNKT